MTQEEFVRGFAEKESVPYCTSKAWIDSIFEYLRETILANDRVLMPRIGVFEHVIHKGHYGQDFRTGERFQLPDRYQLAFKVSKDLKNDIYLLHEEEKARKGK